MDQDTNRLSRRDFLNFAGGAAAGSLVAACQPSVVVEKETFTSPDKGGTPSASLVRCVANCNDGKIISSSGCDAAQLQGLRQRCEFAGKGSMRMTPILVDEPGYRLSEDEIKEWDVWIDHIMDQKLHGLHFKDYTAGLPHVLLIPATGELDPNLVDVVFMIYTIKILETLVSYKAEQVDLTFNRPVAHEILIVNREDDIPPFMLTIGEFTLTTLETDKLQRHSLSIINLAGMKSGGKDPFELVWNYFQAICLGYTLDDINHDPQCNILAANAAFGWTHTREEALKALDGTTRTQLGGFSSPEDFSYVYLEDIFNAFHTAKKELVQ